MPSGSEHDEQAAFFRLVRHYREQGYREFEPICAVPNGGERGNAQAAILQGEGVEPGVPDVLVLRPKIWDGPSWSAATEYEYHYMAIEFKAPGRENDKSSIQDWSQLVPSRDNRSWVGKGLTRPKPDGGLSDYQLAWATTLVDNGGYFVVVYSWLEAWNELCDYLGLPQLKERG